MHPDKGVSMSLGLRRTHDCRARLVPRRIHNFWPLEKMRDHLVTCPSKTIESNLPFSTACIRETFSSITLQEGDSLLANDLDRDGIG
jgi:hypothetical protein